MAIAEKPESEEGFEQQSAAAAKKKIRTKSGISAMPAWYNIKKIAVEKEWKE